MAKAFTRGTYKLWIPWIIRVNRAPVFQIESRWVLHYTGTKASVGAIADGDPGLQTVPHIVTDYQDNIEAVWNTCMLAQHCPDGHKILPLKMDDRHLVYQCSTCQRLYVLVGGTLRPKEVNGQQKESL